jgi:hypothetical protein
MAEPAHAAHRQELTREQREYQFRRIVAHLSEAETWPKIFDLLEKKPFLADQADHCGGFEPSGSDVERYAIPATIRLGDWNRFLYYAALALNLRGLAESLAEPDILHALVREGRFSLARDVVERLADPLRRAEARSVLASACRSRSDLLPDLLRGIEGDLEDAAPTGPVLAMIARSLGPELASHWQGWIERLPSEPDASAEVWTAVAGSWLDRGETRTAGLWEALAQLNDRGRLLELVARLGRLDGGDVDEALTKLTTLFGEDAPARWQAVALYLDRQTRRRPECAVTVWERWVQSEPILWTVGLVESCREVLKRLSSSGIETFSLQLEGPEARAALRVADLEARPDGRRTAAALEAVSQIPDGPAKLHWSLRYLEARPPEPADEVRGQVGAVAAYLHELRYDAAAGDLRQFLDLAARFYPKEMGRLVEDVAWSPASRPETLLTLASETRQETVAAQLLEHAERFAAAASLTEAEGFKLRGELIRRAACRLTLLRMDLQALATAIERLLPEEEDELRETLAPALAEATRREEAREVAEGIRDPRRRFLTLLRVLPVSALPADFLSSRSLYTAMASARPLDEERLALSVLLRNPFDPQDLARRYVLPIRSGDLRAQALLRLARHALAFQRSFYGKRQDRVAALEVVRSSLAVETDERLAALTPEIAALGSEMGLKEAAAEFQEAGRQLAGLGTVPWSVRAAALEHLLSLIAPVLLAGTSERRARRKAAAVLESMARLPIGPRSEQALDELRSHWHEILPILLAVAERLPGTGAVSKAVREGIAACDGAGGEAAENVFSLCLIPPVDRLTFANTALASPLPEPTLLQALVYLLATHESFRLPEIVRRLPAAHRDLLCLRLVRFRWIDPEAALQLPCFIADPALREEAFLWLNLGGTAEEEWLRSLAALAALRSLDPSEPGRRPVLDRLWSCDPGRSRAVLAGAFTHALRAGGRVQGEASLRLWLHAHLAPALGAEQPQAQQRDEEAAQALKRSSILSPQER